MTTPVGSNLARVTIASPRRRVDLALPESIVVADLLPGVLRNCGEGVADDGQEHGGWALRRGDGTAVDPTSTLGAQGVKDGEILHLVSRQSSWPELDYDDVVDAIATNARLRNRAWTGVSTRRAGLITAALFLLVAPTLALRAGAPWTGSGLALLVGAVVLLVAGIALSRALADAAAGAVIGGVGVIYAGAGAAVVLGRTHPITELGVTQISVGCSGLIVAGIIGYIGIAYATQYFVAAIVAGLLGLIASGAAQLWSMNRVDAAALLGTVAVVIVPMFPLLAIRLGKLPVPALPTTTEELLADPPHPPLSRVHATVKRSDEILTGLFIGSSVAIVYAEYALARSSKLSAAILLGMLAVITLLRSRLLPAITHRLPVFIAGAWGVGLAIVGLITAITTDLPPWSVTPMIVVAAMIVVSLALYFQKRKPTPYFARMADIFDVLLMLAVVPTMCIVVGLFGYVRGIFG